eukprot:CAMPEP_0172520780 /NCGR_PEP_ID=MMETSP1066-20121228/292199_1 /TAXON_ID=671091 /ORGANISM="Coscinodiscus wailesii, Strain CCMP2513" /LENGTH=996 /DNA_ID=CAMNT_0013303589 /DNA_START=78 /DNA_END=3069 /DNA_ORIENTATION=-
MAHQLPSIDELRGVFANTLSPDATVRRAAEKQLEQAKTLPGHPRQVLEIVANSDPNYALVRQAASVHFKNVVKNGWDAEDETIINIPQSDRDLIKKHLVELIALYPHKSKLSAAKPFLSSVPAQIQAQCSEAISIIASYDFPSKWDNLLPDLIAKFSSPDPTIVSGVLLTASSIIKRFRYVQKSDDLYRDIIYVLQRLQEPLLRLFQSMGKEIDQLKNDPAGLTPRFESLRLMCRIFFSLNWQELPEYFEDHMSEWMAEFSKYLQYTNPVLTDDDEEMEASPIDKLQCAIIENLNLYANKDEEPFMPFLPEFTSHVWNLLLKVSAHPKHDRLAAIGIKFLAGLVGKEMHRAVFKEEAALRQIISNIVVPNLKIREVDEERFEDDPQEFILSDIEGSESESRRKCSQELLRAMCRQFEAESTGICLEHIQNMIAEFSADPASKWAAKDVAIYLMFGITIQKESALGVSSLNPKVNLLEFFTSHVLTELQDTNHASRPMVKATSIKFISTFRNQFSKDNWTSLMPLLISHLSSPSIVVHSYAAHAIDKLLTIKDENKQLIFGRQEMQPFLEPLFSSLFSIIDNVSYNENSYVMKCTMRCLNACKEDIIPVTHTVLDKLTEALARVAKNPRDPQFNHYLFESIAVLIRSVCTKDPSHTTAFESLLFTPFQTILQMDITEFTPYVFQLFAQLLEYRPKSAGLGAAYTAILPALLTPVLWDRKSNIPALTRLLCAYVANSPKAIVEGNFLQGVLGVFQKLVASKANEQSGFELLETIITNMPRATWQAYINMINQLLLVRLQSGKTPRYTRLITRYFALLVGKYDVSAYLDSLNSIQAGLGLNLVIQVWLPRLQSDVPVRSEAKIQVVGLTKFVCETPALLADANGQQIWSQSLLVLIKIILSPEYQQGFKTSDDTQDNDDFTVDMGYDTSYSKLHFASRPVMDLFPDIKDAGLALVQSLVKLCQSEPGKYRGLIQQALSGDPKLGAGLEGLVRGAGLSLT